MLPLIEIPLPFGKHIPVHTYGLMIVIGFFLTIWVAQREARRRRLPDFVYDFGLVMLLSGLLGGRLFYYLQNYADMYSKESFLEFFKIWKGGLVFYGGAIGGLLGATMYLWKKGIPLADGMDVAAVGSPMAMAFGRIGCFLNGCCYGSACDPGYLLGFPFPVASPAQVEEWKLGLLDSMAQGSLSLHPAQLYQAGHDFLLCALLLWYVRRPGALRGGAMPLACFMYGLGRFLVEFLRGDHVLTATGLTVSQNVSVLLMAGSGALLGALLVSHVKAVKRNPGKIEKFAVDLNGE